MKRLTKVQRKELSELRSEKRLYIGDNCPSLMRTYMKLVEKEVAQINEITTYGKWFIAAEEEN